MSRDHPSAHHSVSFYNAVIENAQDIIGVLEADGTLIYASPAVKRVLGFEPVELEGTSAFDLVHPDDLELVLNEFARVTAKPRSKVSATYRSRHIDGSYRVIETVGINLLDDPTVQGVVIISRDITERSEAEAALRESEEKYRGLFENMLEGFALCEMIFDDDGIPVDWLYLETNAAFESITGLKDVEGKRVCEIIPEIRRTNPELFEIYGGVASTGAPRQFESRVEQLEVDFSVKVFSPKKNQFVAVFEDITERKAAERRLQQTNIELEGFAHTVSHDLRGPLSALALSNELLAGLLSNATLPEEIREDVFDTISISARNIRKSIDLIEDLLKLAEAGQVPAQADRVDVENVVNQILVEDKPRLREKGAAVDVGDGLGEIIASQTHIYQLFSNLIDNAIKHNDGPDLRVSVASIPEHRPGAHRYRVCDNGGGIPPESLDRIFQPFYKGKAGSTGIGLATVMKIVDVYGGEIRAYNNGGACFEFCLRDLGS